MKTLMFGECAVERTFALRDPNFPTEAEFEYLAAKAIACAYPHYRCVMFGGAFLFEGRVSRPDLALVAQDFSHWFVIEVELVTHSLTLHVLPSAAGVPIRRAAGRLRINLGEAFKHIAISGANTCTPRPERSCCDR
jgi:hypothetical protein